MSNNYTNQTSSNTDNTKYTTYSNGSKQTSSHYQDASQYAASPGAPYTGASGSSYSPRGRGGYRGRGGAPRPYYTNNSGAGKYSHNGPIMANPPPQMRTKNSFGHDYSQNRRKLFYNWFPAFKSKIKFKGPRN